MAERKTIYLCLAHMSEEGWEQKYVKEAFDTNWVVPMGPNVNEFEKSLSEKYPDIRYVDLSRVGAVAGRDLINNAIKSVLVASVLMLLYIAIRFDFFSGLAAIIGLLHDVLIMLSVSVILRGFMRVETTYIAALLTIVGYSINNTIIIFDRIRENSHKPQLRSLKRDKIVDLSVKESLSRTLNTTATTLITVVVLYIFGVDSIKLFALPLIIGIVAGTYSANLINGYVWATLKDAYDMRKKAKTRVKA